MCMSGQPEGEFDRPLPRLGVREGRILDSVRLPRSGLNQHDGHMPSDGSQTYVNRDLLELADLKSIADEGGITFKIATLCSGTEAPIFALQLIQQALYSICGRELFRFEHLLAAELNPFKQAFASRNSDSRVMYKDVRDLTIDKTEA